MGMKEVYNCYFYLHFVFVTFSLFFFAFAKVEKQV